VRTAGALTELLRLPGKVPPAPPLARG